MLGTRFAPVRIVHRFVKRAQQFLQITVARLVGEHQETVLVKAFGRFGLHPEALAETVDPFDRRHTHLLIRATRAPRQLARIELLSAGYREPVPLRLKKLQPDVAAYVL
jgi:hypothetical protein